ncbi:MAG: hypothetical protein ABW202_04845 [Duganella sp.]
MQNALSGFTRRRLRAALAVGFVLCAAHSAAQSQLDPASRQYVKWNSQADAVQKLWDARLTYNRPWQWGTLNQNLHGDISNNIHKGSGLAMGRPPQNTPNSVYLIPKVSIRSGQLPRALHHLAAALLTYPSNTAGAPFYPAYTDSEGLDYLANTDYQRVGTYREFIASGTRSRHDNAMGYLPTVALPACPAPVTAAITTAWNAGTAGNPGTRQAKDALNAGGAMAAYTNAVKWHCYAMRAAPPNSAVFNQAAGYMEFDHPDGPPSGREYSDSNEGRVVYDYINGRVYYTPTHYRPSYRDGNTLQVSINNNCPDGRTCISPFFEIVH